MEVSAYQDKFGGESYNNYTALIRFENNATGVILGNRASGGRVLRSELHGLGIGCYMKIPQEIEIHEDNQVRTLGGWEIDGGEEEDVASYEGVLTMHQHFVALYHKTRCSQRPARCHPFHPSGGSTRS